MLGTCTLNLARSASLREAADLCYAHTAGLPWTCGLKSMYFSSRGVTQEVHLYSIHDVTQEVHLYSLSDAHPWSPSLDMWPEVFKYVLFK